MTATLNEINKMFKEGKSALKTSFFSLKFSPDFLSAVHYFTEAAKGYRKHKQFKQAIESFQEAIKCNKELLESWAEGSNNKEIAEIFLFDLLDYETGLQYLRRASMCYKIAGKFQSGLRIIIDAAKRLIEVNQKDLACKLLLEVFEDCCDNTEDQLNVITFEEVVPVIINLLCELNKFNEAVKILEKTIKIQKTLKNEKKFKISRNYIKIAMLRLITGEDYLVDGVIEDMFSVYDSSCSGDIDDTKQLKNTFADLNNVNLNNLIQYSYSLYETNLLKALRKEFDKRKELAANQQNNANKHFDLDETADTFTNKEEEGHDIL